MDEVQGPSYVRLECRRYRLAATKRNPPRYALAHLQLRGCLDPVDPLVIRYDAFAPQQNVKPPISEAPPLRS